MKHHETSGIFARIVFGDLEILHLSTEGISVLEVLGGENLKLRVVARVTCGQVSATKRGRGGGGGDIQKYLPKVISTSKRVGFKLSVFFLGGGEGGGLGE